METSRNRTLPCTGEVLLYRVFLIHTLRYLLQLVIWELVSQKLETSSAGDFLAATNNIFLAGTNNIFWLVLITFIGWYQ